jgi:IclR family acetate operon transcriptional repressor
VLLAFGEARLPSGRLKAYTPRTITIRRDLEQELERVRGDGYAVAVGEREPDLNAVAAPAFDGDGRLVAIVGVQGPESRFGDGAVHAAVTPLLAAAAGVSSALGWSAE